MRTERITEDAHYQGLRIHFLAHLGPSRVTLQIDIGFGDTVLPEPELVPYPTLLDLPAPLLFGYSRESTIAEKLEAMVSLGMLNSRMKDYYDLWYLSRRFEFNGTQLLAAISATFRHRNTVLTAELVVLSNIFAEDSSRKTLWQAFRNRSHLDDAPESLEDVLSDLRNFLLPILQHSVSARPFTLHWNPISGWTE